MSNTFSGLKGLYRKTKQATKEAFGKASKMEECEEYQDADKRSTEGLATYNDMVTAIRGMLSGYETVKIMLGKLMETMKAMGGSLQDSPLGKLTNKANSMNEALSAYLDVFITKTREETLAPIESYYRDHGHKLEKLKKDYKSARLEHDEVKHALEKAEGKGDDSEKISKLKKEYEAANEDYVKRQLEIISETDFFFDSIKRNTALQLMAMYSQMSLFYEQASRVLGDGKAELDAIASEAKALPEPKLVVRHSFDKPEKE